MDPSRVGELKAFVEACKKDPTLLDDPSLAFLRDYLLSLGADLPKAASAKPASPKVSSMDDIDEDVDDDEDDLDMRDPTLEPDKLDEEIIESALELDGDDVIEPDHNDIPQKVPHLLATTASRWCFSHN